MYLTLCKIIGIEPINLHFLTSVHRMLASFKSLGLGRVGPMISHWHEGDHFNCYVERTKRGEFSFKGMYLGNGIRRAIHESIKFTYSNSIRQSMESSHVQMHQAIQAMAPGMLD